MKEAVQAFLGKLDEYTLERPPPTERQTSAIAWRHLEEGERSEIGLGH